MENKDRKIVSAKGGFFNELTLNIKLIMRLIADKRVNPLLKLLPIGAVVYLNAEDGGDDGRDQVAGPGREVRRDLANRFGNWTFR